MRRDNNLPVIPALQLKAYFWHTHKYAHTHTHIWISTHITIYLLLHHDLNKEEASTSVQDLWVHMLRLGRM